MSGAAVGVIIGLLAAIVAVTRPAFLERTEAGTYDERVRAVMNKDHAAKDIVLIDIAEADIEYAENANGLVWPWPRSVYGQIAEYAKAAGAKVVVFDWLYQDRGAVGGANDDEQFAEYLTAAGNVVFGLALTTDEIVGRPLEGPFAARLAGFETEAEATKVGLKLAAWNVRSFILNRVGKYELWYGGKKNEADVHMQWETLTRQDDLEALFAAPAPPEPPADDKASEQPAGEPEQLPPPEPTIARLSANELSQEMTVKTLIRERDGIPLAGQFPRREGLDPPLAMLAAAPARLGNVYQNPEADGILRRHAPLALHGNVAYPSLPLAALLVGHKGMVPKVEGRTLVLGDKRIGLDDEGLITLRYHGHRVYPHISAFEILQSIAQVQENTAPIVPAEKLKDKYLIVSATGQALRDMRPTPVSTRMLGAEIQATALDNMLNGNAIRRAPRWLDGLIAFFMSVLISGLMILPACAASPTAKACTRSAN